MSLYATSKAFVVTSQKVFFRERVVVVVVKRIDFYGRLIEAMPFGGLETLSKKKIKMLIPKLTHFGLRNEERFDRKKTSLKCDQIWAFYFTIGPNSILPK